MSIPRFSDMGNAMNTLFLWSCVCIIHQHEHRTQSKLTNQCFSGKPLYWSWFTMHVHVIKQYTCTTDYMYMRCNTYHWPVYIIMSVIIYPQVDMLRFHVSIWGTPPKAHSLTSERHVSAMRVPTHPMKFMMKCMPPNRKTKFWNRSGFAHVMFTATW